MPGLRANAMQRKRVFKDFSNVEGERVDQIDTKISAKEYYDTALLSKK